MLYCVVDSSPYQLSCPGTSVGRALTQTAECRGFESHPRVALLSSLEKRTYPACS